MSQPSPLRPSSDFSAVVIIAFADPAIAVLMALIACIEKTGRSLLSKFLDNDLIEHEHRKHDAVIGTAAIAAAAD